MKSLVIFARMRMSCKEWIFFLLFFANNIVSKGQVLQFENITTRDGLPSEEVFNFHQDSKGYLWVFTNYGVVKYNSQEFKPVLKNIPFHESFIYTACESENGDMYVANSKAHIYKIRNDSAYLIRGTEKLSEELRQSISEILQIYVDEKDVIYIITKRESHMLVPGRTGYTAHLIPVSEDSVYFKVIKKGNEYLPIHNFNGNDLVRHGGRKRLYIRINDENSSRIVELRHDARIGVRHLKKFGDALYACLDNYFVKIRNDSVSYRKLSGYVLNYTQDKNGHTWIGCFNGGLYELDKNDSIVNHYFTTTSINDVMIDKGNGLWVSTTGEGIYHCKNLGNIVFKPQSILGTPISFVKHLDKTLFVANINGDICAIKDNKIDTVRKHSTTDQPVDLILDSDNRLLVSMHFGVEVTGKSTSTLDLANVVRFLPGKGDTMICLMRRDIVLLVKDNPVARFNLLNKAYSIAGRNGEFMVGTENGAYILEGRKLIQPEFLKPTANYIASQFCTDPSGDVWICTVGNGLFRLRPNNKLTHYNTASSMPGNIVHDISFIKNGKKALLSTNKGLYLIDPLQPFVNMRQLYAGEVWQAVSFDNKIYIATKKGLAILDEGIAGEGTKTFFNLNNVNINGRQIPDNRLSALPYDHNNPEFVFDIISYSQDVPRIQYELHGPIEDKGNMAGQHIRFQNLKPGTYTLSAFPKVPEGEKSTINIVFQIKPVFWQTRWFLVSMIAALLAILILITRLFFRYYKKREEKRTYSEKLILEYQLIALKAQVNPHFVSNCLTAIQHLIVKNQLDAATVYIAKFGLLVRQILNFSSKPLATLPEELHIARLNIEMEQLRFKHKFDFDVKYELLPGRMPEDIFVPALVLNPVIENAIWHGLLPSAKTQKHLLILVREKDKMLHLIIEDNGVGRSAKKNSYSNIRESKGIMITEQRLANINYLYGVKSSGIRYEDLFDENGDPGGTRAIISLPSDLRPMRNE